MNGRQTAQRLMNLFGGSLGFYNSYSWACISAATPTVYGTAITGNQRQDWLNTKYILMWGWNPAEMRDGTNSEYFVRKARERGARIVCIDPRMTLSAVSLADEWIPIRPGTDAAMMSAMAYVMITERPRTTRSSSGRTASASTRPRCRPGCEGDESYKDYILGTRDGVAKTPEWAEPITGVPRETIARIAREYATTKPAVLYQGYGMQRRAYGEQVVRAGCVLAAITGNVGVPGGWAGGIALQAPDGGPFWIVFPDGRQSRQGRDPELPLDRGRPPGQGHGPRRRRRRAPIGSTRTSSSSTPSPPTPSSTSTPTSTGRRASSRDETRVEFLVVQDNFLTPTGALRRHPPPGLHPVRDLGRRGRLEVRRRGHPDAEDRRAAWRDEERLPHLRRDRRRGSAFGDAYTEGRDERDWVDWALDRYRQTRFPGLPSLDEFEASNAGVYSVPVTKPAVAFADFRRDPARPSAADAVREDRDLLEAAPRPRTGPTTSRPSRSTSRSGRARSGPRRRSIPLQAIGHHSLSRVHSTHDNVDWLEEAFPQRVFINPVDAAARGHRGRRRGPGLQRPRRDRRAAAA